MKIMTFTVLPQVMPHMFSMHALQNACVLRSAVMNRYISLLAQHGCPRRVPAGL
jgi:hypothetical protein